MSICAWCKEKACAKEDRAKQPPNCPMGKGEWLSDAIKEYQHLPNRQMAQRAAHIEKTGYCQWTRLQETAEFARAAGYSKLGLAFCSGLHQEARIVADYYKKHGFEVVSAICSLGGVEKETVGIAKDDKFSPEGFEAMCNPIGQAKLCNENNTKLQRRARAMCGT